MDYETYSLDEIEESVKNLEMEFRLRMRDLNLLAPLLAPAVVSRLKAEYASVMLVYRLLVEVEKGYYGRYRSILCSLVNRLARLNALAASAFENALNVE